MHYDQRTQHADRRPQCTEKVGDKRVDHVKAIAFTLWILIGFVIAIITGWCATAWWYSHFINGPNG
jgi:hypothetical protein